MSLVADVFDPRPDVELFSNKSRVGRLFRLATSRGPMLANVVEVEATVGVRPQPALGTVESGAVVVATRQVPERYRHGLPIDPEIIRTFAENDQFLYRIL